MDGKITITKPCSNIEEDYISIAIKDETSKTKFLEVKMSLERFAECLMGVANTDCKLKYNRLDSVGKIKQTRRVSVDVTMHGYAPHQHVLEGIAGHNTPDGWEYSNSFGSKDNFSYKGDEIYFHFTIFRYVDPEDVES